MEREKSTENGWDINVEPAVRHQIPLGIFAVMRDENGKEREVDIRDIVGSKGKNKEENK